MTVNSKMYNFSIQMKTQNISVNIRWIRFNYFVYSEPQLCEVAQDKIKGSSEEIDHVEIQEKDIIEKHRLFGKIYNIYFDHSITINSS